VLARGRERGAEHRYALVVDGPRGGDEAPVVGHCGSYESRSVAQSLGEPGRLEQRLAEGGVALGELRVAEPDEQLTATSVTPGAPRAAQLERPPVPAGRRSRLAPLQGVPAGSLRPPARGFAIGGLGAVPVLGELRRSGVAVAAVERLHRLGRAAVQPATPGRTGLLAQRGLDQGVDEAEACSRTGKLHEESRALSLVEKRGDLGHRKVGHAREEPELPLPTGERRCGEDSRRLGAEPPRPLTDDVAHRFGRGGGELLRAESPRVVVVLDAALRAAQDLRDEERVAARFTREGPGELAPLPARRAAGSLVDEPLDRSCVESAEGQVEHSTATPGVLEGRGQEIGMRDLGGPVGDEHERPWRLGRRQDVLQEHERRLVGPVQVVEHEQERRGGGGRRENGANRSEEDVAIAAPESNTVASGASPALAGGRSEGTSRPSSRASPFSANTSGGSCGA